MTTITWTIVAIDYDINGGVKVPTRTHWVCSGEDAEGNMGRYIGAREVTQGDTKTFTGWDNITEEVALEWLLTNMSIVTMDVDEEGNVPKSQKDTIEAAVNAQIAEQAKPTKGTGLPWAAPKAITMDITE